MSGYEGIIAAAIAAAASVGTTAYSSHQQDKSEKRQLEYQQSIIDEEKAAEAKEKELALQAKDRDKAYRMSLLQGDTVLQNALTSSGHASSMNDEYSLLGFDTQDESGANYFL